MHFISNRLSRFQPSLTVKISQIAREMSEAGERVISLSSGEPDFDTPNHIKNSAIEAINSGFTKYTQVDGIPELVKDNTSAILFSLSNIDKMIEGIYSVYSNDSFRVQITESAHKRYWDYFSRENHIKKYSDFVNQIPNA